MAMTKCAECKKEISDQATACPSCGAPLKCGEINKATTIEKTSKALKTQILASLMLTVISLILAITCAMKEGGGSTSSVAIFSIGFMFGMLWFIVTKFRIWWHHE